MDSTFLLLGKRANLAAVGDMNNDGALDVVFHNVNDFGFCGTDISDPLNHIPLLYENLVAGIGYGGSNTPHSEDLAVLDHDLDGNTDFIVARMREGDNPTLFINDINRPERFHLGDAWSGFGSYVFHTGICVADFDNNGDSDIMFARTQPGPSGNKFYWTGKQVSSTNNWIAIELNAPVGSPVPSGNILCNRDCIGATVVVHAGAHTQAQLVDGGSGRTSQGDRSLLFGLGDYSGAVDVEITLPGGAIFEFEGLVSNEKHILPLSIDLDELSVDLVIVSSLEDGTEDWVVTWETDYMTDVAIDFVRFDVGPNDGIQTVSGHIISPPYSVVDVTGNATVTLEAGKYQHTSILSNVICVGGRTIDYEVWNYKGSYEMKSGSNYYRVRFCLQQ